MDVVVKNLVAFLSHRVDYSYATDTLLRKTLGCINADDVMQSMRGSKAVLNKMHCFRWKNTVMLKGIHQQFVLGPGDISETVLMSISSLS